MRVTEWLPLLFGDQAEKIQAVAASAGRRIDGRALQPWVDKFEGRRQGYLIGKIERFEAVARNRSRGRVRSAASRGMNSSGCAVPAPASL